MTQKLKSSKELLTKRDKQKILLVAIGVEAEGGHVYTVRETCRNKKKEEERTRKTKKIHSAVGCKHTENL